MKVVAVSNYNDEMMDDKLVCSEVDEFYGKLIIGFLNERNGERGPLYFELKPDNYRLYKAPL